MIIVLSRHGLMGRWGDEALADGQQAWGGRGGGPGRGDD